MGTNIMLDALYHPEAIQTGAAPPGVPWPGQAWDARLRGFVTTLDARVSGSAGHGHRVAAQSRLLARRLGLEECQVAAIGHAARVHDIGKIVVSPEILEKPGELTPGEYTEVKRHAAFGARLVGAVGDPELTAIVRHHHERLDGSGYPDGLRGEELDLETRILAVADVWDALVSPRVYRGAWIPERAMALLVAESGSGFDARCVDALRALTGVVPAAADAPLADAA